MITRKIYFENAINAIAKMQRDHRITTGPKQYTIKLVAERDMLEDGPFEEYKIEQFDKFKVYFSAGYALTLNAYIILPDSVVPVKLEDFLTEGGWFNDYVGYYAPEQDDEATTLTNQEYLQYPLYKI